MVRRLVHVMLLACYFRAIWDPAAQEPTRTEVCAKARQVTPRVLMVSMSAGDYENPMQTYRLANVSCKGAARLVFVTREVKAVVIGEMGVILKWRNVNWCTRLPAANKASTGKCIRSRGDTPLKYWTAYPSSSLPFSRDSPGKMIGFFSKKSSNSGTSCSSWRNARKAPSMIHSAGAGAASS
jgi:hypothetical protein